MRTLLLSTLVAAIPLCAASAQSPSNAPPPTQAAPAVNQPILLDVVVNDHDNHPLRNLQLSDFHLTDDGLPQTIRAFAEHSSLAPKPESPQLPALPPGTYTDYIPLPPNAPLTILLLDALNTPTRDPGFIRYQLQQYVKQANPGTRIAIVGLANRVILLQGFNSDPSILRTAVEHKLIPRSPALLNRSTGASHAQPPPQNPASGPSPTDLAANLREFEAETGSMETEFRTQFTLDALNTLAHYLAAIPGRKNLIWLSSSFPFTTVPTPAQAIPPASDELDELHETVNLLAKARVSIDPVNASSLIAQPAYLESNPTHPTHFTGDLNKFHLTEAAEHTRMDQLATSTGGQAFYQPTSLAAAVAQAIAAESNFYTLAYTPTNPAAPGSYRQLQLSLSNSESASAMPLAYRRGYYAPSTQPPSPGRTRAYDHAAMSRGAPAPEDLLFKARVLPASTQLETSVAPDNQLDPDVSPKGPFRRYALDYIALPAELTFLSHPNGNRSATVEFIAYVFDTSGRLLNATGKTISFTATPANFSQLQHSAMKCHLEISVPDRQETFLRIAIRDVPSNKFGVVELPIADVSHLPPPTYAPRSAPSVHPTPSPTPPTQPPTPPQD